MTESICSLGIAVDTRDVKEATSALNDLADAAERANAALGRLGVKIDPLVAILAVKDAKRRNVL